MIYKINLFHSFVKVYKKYNFEVLSVTFQNSKNVFIHSPYIAYRIVHSLYLLECCTKFYQPWKCGYDCLLYVMERIHLYCMGYIPPIDEIRFSRLYHASISVYILLIYIEDSFRNNGRKNVVIIEEFQQNVWYKIKM